MFRRKKKKIENEATENVLENIENHGKKRDYFLPISILVSTLIIAGAWIYTSRLKVSPNTQSANIVEQSAEAIAALEKAVLPKDGIVLPVKWGNIGLKMVQSGVIDKDKFEALYAVRGGLDDEVKQLLYGSDNGNLKISETNSQELLNLLWAFGLGNKNIILEKGPMVDEKYGGAGNFASTGGWTLAKGDAMQHYSKYSFITLTEEQQKLVERVSQGIFRPCCGNSTYFPDCNHGMAMLGLLEIMASQGVSEEDMYKVALQVNAYWFPDTYLTLAKYFASKNIPWNKVNPQEALSGNFSSASGYKRVLTETTPPAERNSGGGCGV